MFFLSPKFNFNRGGFYVDANTYTHVHTYVYISSESVGRYIHEYDIHCNKIKNDGFFFFFGVLQVLRRHILPASERILVVDFRVDPVSEPLQMWIWFLRTSIGSDFEIVIMIQKNIKK